MHLRGICAKLAPFSMHGFGNYAWGFAGGFCCWQAWLLVGWAASGFCCWQACRQYYDSDSMPLYRIYITLYCIVLRGTKFILRGYLRTLAHSCVLEKRLNYAPPLCITFPSRTFRSTLIYIYMAPSPLLLFPFTALTIFPFSF